MKSSAALAPALRDAARLVARVAAGHSLNDISRTPGAGELLRGAVLDLTHGTLRRYGRVQAIVRRLSTRVGQDATVEALLWCALYALDSGRYADYTVVDQAVRACSLLEKWPAKSYVNALLRAYLRSRDTLEASASADDEARYWHPRWWIDALRQAYPDRWEEVLAAGNARPPMTLRVNPRRNARDAYQERLAAAGMASRAIGPQALLLEQPVPAERVPGFQDGDVSIQDAGAQRAAPCLELAPGLRVLDACAAPGGKSAHILELAAVDLTAVDIDAERCERVRANLDRLKLRAESIVTADASRPKEWWDGRPFDRILADVPCSASGVVRRHPDLKWLRRAADLAGFAERQALLLDSLWRMLRPGGKLLYVTCSVFPSENDAVVEAFAQRTPDAARAPLADAGDPSWLPTAEHDGFFFSLIQRRA